MSHFPVIVLVPPLADPKAEAERMLAPYDEDGTWFRGAEGDRPPSRWDWWTIGGRWTGSLDGYDPQADPLNTETCDLCGGTGDRASWRNEPRIGQHPSGCNGCSGKGQRLKWSTDWADHDGDILPVAAIDQTFIPYAIVTPDGRWHEKGEMGWFAIERSVKESDGDWGAIVQKLYAEHADAVAVLVDCHV